MAKITFLLIMVFSPFFGHSLEVQGHRGARGMYPENSLPAFESAILDGVDTLELDVLGTKEGELIIYHDYFLNPKLSTYLDGRPITEDLLICSLPLGEIKKIDCGRQTNPDFPKQIPVPGAKIPALIELFQLISTSDYPNAKTVRLNLEIKSEPTHPEFTLKTDVVAKKIISLVQEYGLKKRVYYSSFDPDVLLEIKKIDPEATLALLVDQESLEKIRFIDPDATIELIGNLATRLGVSIISPEHIHLQERDHVRSLQTLGLKVVTWTVNDPIRWQELIEMGVEGIITDYPQDLISFLNQE